MIERGPGRNFTDRQRIKRKAERWAAKFAALPALERAAVLEAVLMVGEFSTVNRVDPRQLTIELPEPQTEPTMFHKDSATAICRNCGHGEDDHDWLERDSPCFYSDHLSVCECPQYVPLNMPGSGITKLSPRESAEPGGPSC